MRTRLEVCGSLILGFAVSAAAQIEWNDNPAEWGAIKAEKGKVTKGIIDFDNDPDYGIEGFSGPLTSAGAGPVSPGVVLDNVIINTLGNYGTNLAAFGPSYGWGQPSNGIVANYFVDALTIQLTEPNHSMVMLNHWSIGGGTVDVSFFDKQGALIDVVRGVSSPEGGEHPVLYWPKDGSVTISRIEIFAPGGHAEGIMQAEFWVGWVPPTGACCNKGTGECVDDTTEDECDYVFYEGEACVDIECKEPPRVACCLPDNSCAMMTQQACQDAEGTPGGSDCETNTGACCKPDGTCVDTIEECCDDADCNFHLGRACADIECDGGKVMWENLEPIEGATIEAYYLKVEPFEVVPLAPRCGPTYSAEDGAFVMPPEFYDPTQPGEVGGGDMRGVRATVDYDEYPDTVPWVVNPQSITNYPECDPAYPLGRPTSDEEVIRFPYPVIFQPGVNGQSAGGSAADLRAFFTLDAGGSIHGEHGEWVLAKRGNPGPRIPAFLFFGMPSRDVLGPWPNDDVDWGYNNSPRQSAARVNDSAARLQSHIMGHVRLEIAALTPGNGLNVPFHITAHSLGGIISRRWIKYYTFPATGAEVHREKYVTFDAVHGGTAVFLSGFLSEKSLNGTSSDDGWPPLLRDQGWNYANDLPSERTHLLFSAPQTDDPWYSMDIITPDASAWGIGRIIKPRFLLPDRPNGYCERFVGGWELAADPARGHSIQNEPEVFIAAARFLANSVAVLGTPAAPRSLAHYAQWSVDPVPDELCTESKRTEPPWPGYVEYQLLGIVPEVAEEALFVDSDDLIHIGAYVSESDASLTVHDENGVEYARLNERIDPFDTTGYTSGFDVEASAGIGTIRLTPGAQDTVSMVTVTYTNGIYAAVSTDESHYSASAPVTATAALLDEGDQVIVGSGGTVSAVVRKPDASETMLPLFDDGAHEDGAPGDGVYGNVFTETEAVGRYSVEVDATIDSGDFTIRRMASTMFVVDSDAGSLLGVVGESLRDDNGDGEAEAIVIDLEMDFIANGEFRLSADLLDEEGSRVQRLDVAFEIDSAPTQHIASLEIPGVLLHRLGSGGPWTIGSITLFDDVEGLYLDSLPDYQTQAYDLDEFEEPPAPVVWFVMPSYGLSVGGYEVIVNGDNMIGISAIYFGDQLATDFEVLSETAVSVVVPEGDCGVEGAVTLRLVTPWHDTNTDGVFEYADLSLEILANPGDQTECEESTATFSVLVQGTPPLSYQWRRDGVDLADGGNISGATTETLMIDPVGDGDAGDYDVEVSNECGSVVVSEIATLSVGVPGPLDNGIVRASFNDYGTSGVRFPHEESVSAEIAWLAVSPDSQAWSWEGNLNYDGANHRLNDANEFAVTAAVCLSNDTVTSASRNSDFDVQATHTLDGATLTTRLEITNVSGGDLTDVNFAWMLDADLKLAPSDSRAPCCEDFPWLGFGSGRWFGDEGAGVQTNVNRCAGIWPAEIAAEHSARMDGAVVPSEWMVGNPIGLQGSTCRFDGVNETEPRYLFEQPFDNTAGCVGFDQDLSIVTNFAIADWLDGESHTFTYTLTFRPPGDADDDGNVALTDFEALLACVTGPGGGPITAECETFDFDCDDDVDLIDFAGFQSAFTGSQ